MHNQKSFRVFNKLMHSHSELYNSWQVLVIKDDFLDLEGW